MRVMESLFSMNTDLLMRPVPKHQVVLQFNYEKKVVALSFWQWTKGVVLPLEMKKENPLLS